MERRHALRTLLILLEKGRLESLSDLVKLLGVRGMAAASRCAKELEELGLVKLNPAMKPPLTVEIELTPLGRKVAEHVKAIDELLKGGEGS